MVQDAPHIVVEYVVVGVNQQIPKVDNLAHSRQRGDARLLTVGIDGFANDGKLTNNGVAGFTVVLLGFERGDIAQIDLNVFAGFPHVKQVFFRTLDRFIYQ